MVSICPPVKNPLVTNVSQVAKSQIFTPLIDAIPLNIGTVKLPNISTLPEIYADHKTSKAFVGEEYQIANLVAKEYPLTVVFRPHVKSFPPLANKVYCPPSRGTKPESCASTANKSSVVLQRLPLRLQNDLENTPELSRITPTVPLLVPSLVTKNCLIYAIEFEI